MSCKNSGAQAEKGDRLSCPGNAGLVWSASASTVALLALESSKWGFNTINIYFSKTPSYVALSHLPPVTQSCLPRHCLLRGKERAFFCCRCFQLRPSPQSRGSVNRCAGETGVAKGCKQAAGGRRVLKSGQRVKKASVCETLLQIQAIIFSLVLSTHLTGNSALK